MKTQTLLLVDDNDVFSGEYAEKELCHIGQGKHHRAFVVVVFNNKNQILLQKRKHKRWDNVWDVTAISHVLHFPDHDETYDEAALRSLKTEVGIPIIPLKKIGAFNYFAQYEEQCENEYCAVLTGIWSGTISPNFEVMYDYKWINKNEFIKDCEKNPSKYAPWTVLTAEVLKKK